MVERATGSEGSFQPITHTTAVIRTSDRIQFKSCRRRWALQSHLKRNLEPTQQASPLWFGTGFHFALEDRYGSQKFERLEDAFIAYVRATTKQARQELPNDVADLVEMGKGMLNYYQDYWVKGRDELTTLVVDGVPQVEVNFTVEVPFDVRGHFPDSPFDRVVYAGTIDRVTVDEHGRIWLVDYKTAKQMKATHFSNDSQVTSYCWAASRLYDRPVAGLIYWQFLKAIPKPPEPLVSGGISVAQNQRTTHRLYREALIKAYGSVNAAPMKNVDFLNQLSLVESEDHDPYIRRDRIFKNPQSLESEGAKILIELEDILNPNLPLYPNPNWTCPMMCPFYEVCISMDDGSDWEDQLASETQSRAAKNDSWRRYLEAEMSEEAGLLGDGIDLSRKDFE
jgi:hypothetical protein